ncbi:MAG: iron-sulfur cluster assembly accessory protein [Phycisphaerae bacterium]|jgi:iron-sulfur cluster assembly protein
MNDAQQQAAGSSARQRAQSPAEGQGIRLTEKAAGQIRAILDKESLPETMYLYVGVKGGGCSGLQYVLDLRDETQAPAAETDEVFLSQDIMIVCDLKSFVAGNLAGTTIDYQDGLMGAGFIFNNPNAKHQCGCGASYSA